MTIPKDSIFHCPDQRNYALVFAETGSWIDADGRIRQQGPRRRTVVIQAAVELDDRRSLYIAVGDWPAGLCLALALAWAVLGARRRWWPPGEPKAAPAGQRG